MDLQTNKSGSLDDSLTSIHWLCQLESNRLLESKSHERRQPVTSSLVNHGEENNNPYPKPQYSYATLIVLAISSTRDKRMTLQGIYHWIEGNFPYFKYAKKGWKNSIRHNLSLHKFFIKERRCDLFCGKGSYWRMSPEGKENLMRDLLKPPPNLTPPIALLPHDPNRKLRHILPKPTSDATKFQYVPIVFVPSLNDAKNDNARDPLQTVPARNTPRNYDVSPFQQNLVSTHTKSATRVVVENPVDPKSSVSVESGNDIGDHESVSFSMTPSEENSTKAALCTPTQECSGDNISSRTPKEASSKRRSQVVSKNLKRVPNILRRKKQLVKSPERHEDIIHSPLKNCLQSTLAAINSSNHAPCSPNKRVDDPVNIWSSTQSSPLGHNRSLDFLQYGFSSPGISPLRSPFSLTSGLTPLRQNDYDSGIVSTPINSCLGDISLNWTPFKTGFTPISPFSSQSHSGGSIQRCRKSLGLEQID